MILYTARYSTRDRDWLDITRAGGTRALRADKPAPGIIWAPSARLVFPALAALKAAEDTATRDALWAEYAAAYRLEMLDSYREHRAAWQALLAKERLVAVCFCQGADERCHRFLLARFLSSPKFGADYRGELTEADRIPPPPKTAAPPAVLLGNTRGKCTPFLVTDGGLTGIVCGDRVKPRRCVGCRKEAALLCDYPRGGKTCDAPICEGCAREVGEDRHHCPKHAEGEPAGKAVAEAAPSGQVGWGW